MKIVMNKDKLSEIVNTVQKAVSQKSTIELLECIKIEAENNGHVTITGNNIELCIEYNTECEVEESGSVALEAKMFGEIIRKMPQGNVSINTDEGKNNVTKIKNGKSEFNIQGLNTEDYPAAPVVEEINKFKINEKKLKELIRKTIFFTAVNEGKKPVLTGTLFELKENMLNVVASDGHRLAVVREELKENEGNFKFVVPRTTLNELLKIIGDDEKKEVEIILSERNVLFDFKDFQVYTRLIEGEFLKYDAIISVVNTINVVAEKNLIINSLERALLLINDDIASKTERRVPVKLNIGYDKIDISCITGKGQVNDTVDVKMSGGELTIGFNCSFLLDALRSCDEEQIKMEFSAATSGCFIKPVNDNNSFVFMVLPVRLYN